MRETLKLNFSAMSIVQMSKPGVCIDHNLNWDVFRLASKRISPWNKLLCILSIRARLTPMTTTIIALSVLCETLGFRLFN